MPPLRRAADRLGPITPAVAAATGLDPATPVVCGIHDSNASLLPHLLHQPAPFAVVSTGTWVVAMAIGGRPAALDPRRDTLINVSAFGDPVPSARFMGGREWSRLTRERGIVPEPAEVDAVLARGLMLFPAVEPGSGPFAGRTAHWSVPDAVLSEAELTAAASLYLALMTGVCLEMIGAAGLTLVEGPFAANALFMEMLATVTGRGVAAAATATGTSAGAALLALPTPPSATPGARIPEPPPERRAALAAYAARWRREVEAGPAIG